MNETVNVRLGSVLLLLLSLLLGGCRNDSGEPPLAGASLGGPFTLTDQNGRRVSDRDFAGRYRIVYFGFASCPDVCPTDLQTVGAALRAFERSDAERAQRVQPIFITVDPARDTPAVLRDYVANFHPRLIGLTGTESEVAQVDGDRRPPSPGDIQATSNRRTLSAAGPRGAVGIARAAERRAERRRG